MESKIASLQKRLDNKNTASTALPKHILYLQDLLNPLVNMSNTDANKSLYKNGKLTFILTFSTEKFANESLINLLLQVISIDEKPGANFIRQLARQLSRSKKGAAKVFCCEIFATIYLFYL